MFEKPFSKRILLAVLLTVLAINIFAQTVLGPKPDPQLQSAAPGFSGLNHCSERIMQKLNLMRWMAWSSVSTLVCWACNGRSPGKSPAIRFL